MTPNKRFFILSFILIALISFLPHSDTDLGWHLRYGQYFIENLKFMKTNDLTYLMPGYVWPNSYGLYQIFIYVIYKYFGLLGLSALSSILLISTYYLFSKIEPKLRYVNLVFFLILIFTSWHVFHIGARAQVFSFTFLVMLWGILKNYRKKEKYLYFLPPLFVLWANIHGEFILGVIVTGVFVFSQIIKYKLKVSKILLAASFLSLIGTLINPYGIGIYEEAIRHMKVPMHTLIAEWLRPVPWIQVCTVIITLIITFLLFKKRQNNWLFFIILIPLFAYITLDAKRNIPVFLLFVVFAAYDLYKNRLLKIEKSIGLKNIIDFIIPVALVSVGFVNLTNSYNYAANQTTYCSKGIWPYPCDAVKFIKENPPKGENVYSAYEWGGYLSWELPMYKFFVDGRTPAWPTPEGKSPYTIYLEIIQAREGYQEKLDEYKTDWLFIGAGTFLDIELKEKEDSVWKEAYRDRISVIYTKK